MGKRGDLNEFSDPSSKQLASSEELHNAVQSNGRQTAGGHSTDRSPGLVQYNNWYVAKQIGTGLNGTAVAHKQEQVNGVEILSQHIRAGPSEFALSRDDAHRIQRESAVQRLQHTLKSHEKAKDELKHKRNFEDLRMIGDGSQHAGGTNVARTFTEQQRSLLAMKGH